MSIKKFLQIKILAFCTYRIPPHFHKTVWLIFNFNFDQFFRVHIEKPEKKYFTKLAHHITYLHLDRL